MEVRGYGDLKSYCPISTVLDVRRNILSAYLRYVLYRYLNDILKSERIRENAKLRYMGSR